jgi:hypothetical protein
MFGERLKGGGQAGGLTDEKVDAQVVRGDRAQVGVGLA